MSTSDRTFKAMITQNRLDMKAVLSFAFTHLMCLWAFKTGVSKAAVIAALITYFARVFALTAGYHRLFSHMSYKTSRVFQFILAFVGAASAQMGPLWWASHHRDHHKYSDTDQDPHSPRTMGFFMSHMGWVMDKRNQATRPNIKDLYQYPELRFLNNNHWIAPISLAVLLYAIGAHLGHYHPEMGTSGFQMLIWGFFISTVAVYHVTFSINSITHLIGYQRFDTKDDSRNNMFTALLTMGEGWHNNHHYYQAAERQGFLWWEIDMTHYILKFLSWFGIVWDIREPPKVIYKKALSLKGVDIKGLN